jgi:hypothetical protein
MSLLARFRREHANRPSDDAEASGFVDEGTDSHFNNPDRLFFPPSSPAGERSGTLEPPAPAQQRRERSNSAKEALEQESQQRHKRCRATQVCKDLDLAEDALDAFTEVSALHLY